MRLSFALVLLSACAVYPTPAPEDFLLPAGDAAAGRLAFIELGCSRCHRVTGDDLPTPAIDPPVPIVIGERSQSWPTDGTLVTAIIHPNLDISKSYQAGTKTDAGDSRMADFQEVMTVRQLIDLVAFIRDRRPH